MKRTLLLIFCLVAINVAKAQPGCPSPTEMNKSNDHKFQLGAGAGLTNLKSVRDNPNAFGLGGYLNIDYKVYRGVFFGLRGQMGTLKVSKTNNNPLEVSSKYVGFGAGIRIHPVTLISGSEKRRLYSAGRDLIEAIYVGADVLHVSNQINSIYRNLGNFSTYGPIESFDGNGDPIFKNKLSSLMLPSLNIGFAPVLNRNRFKRTNAKKNLLRLVLNAQFNFANSDELDGYAAHDANMNQLNNNKDKYQFYSVGLSYSF